MGKIEQYIIILYDRYDDTGYRIKFCNCNFWFGLEFSGATFVSDFGAALVQKRSLNCRPFFNAEKKGSKGTKKGLPRKKGPHIPEQMGIHRGFPPSRYYVWPFFLGGPFCVSLFFLVRFLAVANQQENARI